MAYLGRITPVVSVTSDEITDGTILNADINASAAIAKTKLASLAIVNSDVDGSAAIALSKLATDPSNASNLASGTVPTARLGSGTASSSTFLRGDQTYAEAGGGGKIAQVVLAEHDESGGQTVTTSGWLDTTLSVTITPSATSSKVMLILVTADWDDASSDTRGLDQVFYRDIGSAGASAIAESESRQMAGAVLGYHPYAKIYVDAPSSTSSIEYALYVKAVNSTVYFFRPNRTYQLIAQEISA